MTNAPDVVSLVAQLRNSAERVDFAPLRDLLADAANALTSREPNWPPTPPSPSVAPLIERLRTYANITTSPEPRMSGPVVNLFIEAAGVLASWDRRFQAMEGDADALRDVNHKLSTALSELADTNRALCTVAAAAARMPRETPKAGAASTVHDFKIEASTVWELDAALRKVEQRCPADLKKAQAERDRELVGRPVPVLTAEDVAPAQKRLREIARSVAILECADVVSTWAGVVATIGAGAVQVSLIAESARALAAQIRASAVRQVPEVARDLVDVLHRYRRGEVKGGADGAAEAILDLVCGRSR